MTDAQKDLSSRRERNQGDFAARYDKVGHFEVKMLDPRYNKRKLIGDVDGHNVEVIRSQEHLDTSGTFYGTVDGKDVDAKLAEELWNKCIRYADNADQMERANDEIVGHEKKEKEGMKDPFSKKEKE